MAFNETTSERIARLASLGLFSPETLTPAEIKTVCASALAHVKDHTALAASPFGAFLQDNAISDALTVPEFGTVR
jgi:hypothetical protein